jgi:hypothetical protein
MTFNSGAVNITGCGSKPLSGRSILLAETTFGNGTDALTVYLENNSSATGVKNALVLAGGKNLTIRKKCGPSILRCPAMASAARGTRSAAASTWAPGGSKITVDGTLNIRKGTTTAAAILGINGSACTAALLVNAGGTVNISGYQDAANVLPQRIRHHGRRLP